ncbi:MAG: DoxX family membrane protein [Flavitalea sp.]
MIRNSNFLFRLLTSLIFLYAGIGHLFNSDKILAKLSKSSIYRIIDSPSVFTISILLTGVIMIAGAIMLIANYRVKYAAVALLLVLVPITLSVQLDNPQDLGPFFKNVAIAGSLLLLIKSKQYETN